MVIYDGKEAVRCNDEKLNELRAEREEVLGRRIHERCVIEQETARKRLWESHISYMRALTIA